MPAGSNLIRLCVVVAGLAILPLAANAQATPDRENGRYAFTQSSDGSLLRLDTRDGRVSACKRNSSGWACYATADERDAFDREVGRLSGENARLKDQLAKAEAQARSAQPASPAGQPKTANGGEADKGAGAIGGNNKIELPLPDDKDVDRVVSFLERAWRRLVEAAGRMQRDASGKI